MSEIEQSKKAHMLAQLNHNHSPHIQPCQGCQCSHCTRVNMGNRVAAQVPVSRKCSNNSPQSGVAMVTMKGWWCGDGAKKENMSGKSTSDSYPGTKTRISKHQNTKPHVNQKHSDGDWKGNKDTNTESACYIQACQGDKSMERAGSNAGDGIVIQPSEPKKTKHNTSNIVLDLNPWQISKLIIRTTLPKMSSYQMRRSQCG